MNSIAKHKYQISRTNLTMAQLDAISSNHHIDVPDAGAYYTPIRHIDLANAMLHEFTLAQWSISRSYIWVNDRPHGTKCVINFVREDRMFLAAYNSFKMDKALTFFFGYQYEHDGLLVLGYSKFKHTPNFDLDESVYQMTRRLRMEGIEFPPQQETWKKTRIAQVDSDRILMEAGRLRLIAPSRVFSVQQLYGMTAPTLWNLLDCFAQVNARTPPLLQLEAADRFRQLAEKSALQSRVN